MIFIMFLAFTCRFVTEPFANGFNPQTEQPAPAPATSPTGEPFPPNQVYRYIDAEAGVVCWVTHESGLGMEYGPFSGISCLPLDETKLEGSGQ
jgi:hypothetical protein